MKIRFHYFFWIISLALGLMMLIYLAQLFTNRNIEGLQKGNREAAITFTVQNSLQEIVNIVFILESRLKIKKISKNQLPGIKDSLTLIGYNASVLGKLKLDTVSPVMFRQMNIQVDQYVSFSYEIIEATEKQDSVRYSRLADSLAQLKLSDGIYNTAVQIVKVLENELQTTLEKNTRSSQSLSTYNKVLALVALAAILILGTIIINRHLHQMRLIVDLENANQKVQQSAIVKEQFLANMSHEIRTPLNAIKGFSGLMLKSGLSSEQKQYATIIENASNNLMEIVNDVLDISKIEAGKLMLESKEFNLQQILQMLEFMFSGTAKEKNLRYECHIEESTPLQLKGDTDRLNQILINLISNAIKFTSDGFIKITAKEIKRTGNSSWIQISVEDSGIGISADKLEKVFERFYQVTNNDGTLIKGTGLGLAIVKNLSILMGGDVSVESKEGVGSVFTVSIPFEISRFTMKDKAAEEFTLLTDLTFNNVKVLVAEDNPVNQLLVKYWLKKYGIEPDFSENGREVLELLRSQAYDMLLMDIQMPVMNGYQAIKKIREMGLNLPVVAMTAYVMPGDKEKCLAAGMDDYISKPISEVELQKILIKFLIHKGGESLENKEVPRNFLIMLAGGDKEMANTILKAVKKEIQEGLLKLNSLQPAGENMEDLRSFCHHLYSTVSPLGNDTAVLKSINDLQLALRNNSVSENIELRIDELRDELERLLQENFVI